MNDVRAPVTDWAADFDHAHPDYAANAPAIWDELRERCPVAHTERYGGVWLATRAPDVRAIAEDTDHFSSRGTMVTNIRPPIETAPTGSAPPITSDPPFHTGARRLLLEYFGPRVVNEVWEPRSRLVCRALLDDIERQLDAGTEVIDAAVSYAQHLPVRITAEMLGLPLEDGDLFRDLIRRILECPGGDIAAPAQELTAYLVERIREHRESGPGGHDLVSHLLQTTDEHGNSLSDTHILGTTILMFFAGIDTTWSAIGASLWHLAQHPEDRRRWIEDPDVRSFAVEEFLRFYAPVTMARIVTKETTIGGCPVNPNDWALVSFPSYNRDPEIFERADEFVIDRARNRHAAFGLGIHRCLGSNLARMELMVALEEWLERFGDFELADPDGVRWSAGQVRGPRTVPVRINRPASR